MNILFLGGFPATLGDISTGFLRALMKIHHRTSNFSDKQFRCKSILTLRPWECSHLGSRNEFGGPKFSFHVVLTLSLSVTSGSVFANIILFVGPL